MIPNYPVTETETWAQNEMVGPELAPVSPHPILLLLMLCLVSYAGFNGSVTSAHSKYRIRLLT